MRYLVPGPLPCPEVVAVFYIRPAEVPTLFSVEGDAQVEQQNTVVGFLTFCHPLLPPLLWFVVSHSFWLSLLIFVSCLATVDSETT